MEEVSEGEGGGGGEAVGEWRVMRGEEGREGCRDRMEEVSEGEGEGEGVGESVGEWRVKRWEEGGGEAVERAEEACESVGGEREGEVGGSRGG